MPHIHNEPGQHDHTISIYIFRTDLEQPRVLLHYHNKIGAFAQFGGHIELHETPWQAALHELKEESGYDINALQILQPKQRLISVDGAVAHPHPVAQVTMGYPALGGHFHTDITYAFLANGAPTGTPDEGESTDFKLFSRNDIATTKDVDGVTRDTALYIFDYILAAWQPVDTSEFKA